jgi:hypothetical protein
MRAGGKFTSADVSPGAPEVEVALNGKVKRTRRKDTAPLLSVGYHELVSAAGKAEERRGQGS